MIYDEMEFAITITNSANGDQGLGWLIQIKAEREEESDHGQTHWEARIF